METQYERGCLERGSKHLDAGIVHPISVSHCVTAVQVILKKFCITVVQNNDGALVPTTQTASWRVCIDYITTTTPSMGPAFAGFGEIQM